MWAPPTIPFKKQSKGSLGPAYGHMVQDFATMSALYCCAVGMVGPHAPDKMLPSRRRCQT
eukprot:2101880-Pyramimonas_sp.AAC.1